MSKPATAIRRFTYPMQIGSAVLLGSVTGLLLGPQAQVLGDVGMLIIQILKTLAAPLVFFAIVDAFCKTQMRLRSGLHLLSLSALNALVAGTLAFSVSRLFDFIPASTLDALKTQTLATSTTKGLEPVHVNLYKSWGSLIPQNILEPFLTGNLLSIILISIFLGIAMKRLKSSKRPEVLDDISSIEKFFSGGLRLTSTMLHLVIVIAPVAVFGVIAKIVGANGFQIFSTLGFFVGVVALGILLHAGVYYSFLLMTIGRTSPLSFFRGAKGALATAFGTGSSVATLPVTLDTLKTMKISDESARMAAVIGTNLNHDGILLYEAIAALFIAHLYGIKLAASQKVLLLAISTLAAVGIAGVPDAGLITLSLVLGTLDLPLTFVPVLLAVDWLLGRLRATANVTSDMVVATILNRWK